MKFDKFTDVCMTGGIRHTPSHTNACLKLCRVTKVKVLFLVLVYVFNFNLFEFWAAILEKGPLQSSFAYSRYINSRFVIVGIDALLSAILDSYILLKHFQLAS